jgi:DNA polymerase II
MKGFIVYPTYRVIDNKAYLYFFGRLENGESFLAIKPQKPYFYIKASDLKKAENVLKGSPAEFIPTDFTDFLKNKVTKLILDNPKDVPDIRKDLQDAGISCYEADIRFAYRYLIDNDIKGCINLEGDYTSEGSIDRVYKNPYISPSHFIPKLKVLSIDIETDPKAKELYSISLYDGNYKKVFIKKQGKFNNAISFDTEADLLEAFQEKVIELDPDIITGWNVVDFDLNFLKNAFKRNQIPFQLSRTNWPCKLRLTDSFFNESTADFPGRQVLDGIHLMKLSFVKLDDYKLETAAKEFLNKGKIFKGKERFKQIEEAYQKDPQLLIDYNLKDAKLVYDILEVSGVLALTIRRSMITRMQLDRVRASIASFDSLYLKELQKRKLVAPTAYIKNRGERIIGGYVMDSKPGIYKNLIVLDFKSLYPSIIRTFNIDPYSYIPKELHKDYKKSNIIESPNKAWFKKEEGILSSLIQSLWIQRDKAKLTHDRLTSNAIKILMNSFFGIMANPTFRFYSLEMANAITHFGQFIIKLTAEELRKKGYDVIYADTDSVFVDTKEQLNEDPEKIGKDIQEFVNSFFKNYVKKTYGMKSFLEMEFEKTYIKFLMPHVRKSEEGAKKRYAGLKRNNELEIVGLEAIRRDWTPLAKKFQHELLNLIFHDKDYKDYIKKFVDNLHSGKFDDLLVYKKGIRKSVSEYTKTTPPHIKAARKANIEKPGIIEYVITIQGPEAIGFVKNSIDYKHYLEKQLKPIADSILVFFDDSLDSLVAQTKQVSLSDY